MTFWKRVLPADSDSIIVAEAYGKTSTPPSIEGYALGESHFSPVPPRVLGLPFAADNKGNGFAIYRPKR